jgi:phosphoribosylglycinamide formyltransferase 1
MIRAMAAPPSRIAVLASGGGSNLQAILDYFDALGTGAPGRVALVASNRAAAAVLERARARDVHAVAMDAMMREAGLLALLTEHDIDLIVLAGYLRLIPNAVTQRYRGRIVNVHPALLPAFGGTGMYGARVHQAVIASGARVSGVTIQFVDEVYDHGPIIAQWPVPVFGNDTAESLAARVLAAEHALYPRVVAALAAGRITLDGDRVRGVLDAPVDAAHFALEPTASVARAVDLALTR